MTSRISLLALLASGVFAGLPTPAAADHGRDFAALVPDTMHFFGRWVATEESGEFEKPFIEAVEKLFQSGIGNDIFELATLELDDEEKAGARAVVDRVLELLEGPDWDALVRKEVAFSFRTAVPFPEYLAMFRVAGDTAGTRVEEMRDMLTGIAEFAPEVVSVTSETRGGVAIARMGSDQFPMGISVAGEGDTVIISTSDLLLDSVLGLKDSETAAGSLAKDEAFIRSQKGFPKGAYGLSYFNLKGYFGFFQGMLGMAQSFAQGDARAAAALSIVATMLDELSRMEAVGMAERVEGNRYILDAQVNLEQRDGPGFIEELIAGQKPIENYYRVVPVDASGFYMASGIDLEKIYDAFTKALKERFPDGERLLEKAEAIQGAIGFHVKDDLLSWMEGGFGWISLPAGSGSEHLCFLRLKDDEKAKKVIHGAIEKLSAYLESRGHALRLEPFPDAEGFREVRIPALPWCRPVIGFPGGVLVLATSVDAVQRVRASYSGEAQDIRENPRFAALEFPPGPLAEVFYADIEDSLEVVANVLGTVGFVASLLPEERDTKPLVRIGRILGKLAVFLSDIDLGLDYAGWTRYDAEGHRLFSRQVTTFRRPKARRF